MRGRATEGGLAAIAVLAAGSFLLGVWGWRLPSWGTGSARPAQRPAGRYHQGGVPAAPIPAPACAGDGCHGLYPHGRTLTASSFLNMHAGTADCLACHGKGREAAWKAQAGTEGRGLKILSGGAAEKGADPHALLGRAAACRDCHSGRGRRELTARGAAAFPRDFEDPLPLRMIEREAKRWIPEDMR